MNFCTTSPPTSLSLKTSAAQTIRLSIKGSLHHLCEGLRSQELYILPRRSHVSFQTRGPKENSPNTKKEVFFPPQDSPDNATVDIPDLPLVGPPVPLRQLEASADGQMTRAEFHALVKMMKAL
ncbi:hypothetical protein ACLOJK_015112 [Asimina triloba]